MSASPFTALCLIDTSVFLMMLRVPNTETASTFEKIEKERKEKIARGERFFLPMATILETGNHVQKIKGTHRQCAEMYVDLVKRALLGKAPFIISDFCRPSDVLSWLDNFMDTKYFKMSIGDLWIKHEWQEQCQKNKKKTVYVWTVDSDLAHYQRTAP